MFIRLNNTSPEFKDKTKIKIVFTIANAEEVTLMQYDDVKQINNANSDESSKQVFY